MKQLKLIPCIVLSFLWITALHCQTFNTHKSEKWLLGIGVNFIEDNGLKADIGTSIHFSNPLSLSAEYTVKNNWSINGSLSFNKYKAGKLVDGSLLLNESDANYIAFDVSTKYYVSEALNISNIEPYALAGMGYTNIGSYQVSLANSTAIKEIPQVGRLTLNTGVGTNYWFSNSWGLNLNLMGKFGIKSGENKEYISNQLQFSFGFIYSKSASNWRS